MREVIVFSAGSVIALHALIKGHNGNIFGIPFPLIAGLCIVLHAACTPFGGDHASCYRIRGGGVCLRYYGGYPRASEVFLSLRNADPRSFQYISGSRDGDCQSGHIFGKDSRHVYYRNFMIESAVPAGFVVLGNGFSKDRKNVYHETIPVHNVDLGSFFVIANKKGTPYGADARGLLYKTTRVKAPVDVASFTILFKPYFKDKDRVYYGKDHRIVEIEGADPASFICPEYRQVVNYQYYAYDKKRAYYYEKNIVAAIEAIDYETFTVLGTEYAKDKNRVYYKNRVVEHADPYSFRLPRKQDQNIGEDASRRYKNGIVDDRNAPPKF